MVTQLPENLKVAIHLDDVSYIRASSQGELRAGKGATIYLKTGFCVPTKETFEEIGRTIR